ncbi:hypothetical protein Q4577_15425 [Marinovum sp. 2_MG-2023]|uniref:hypothetical protein n=1 Tax=unclassified Marinovum TaxID=2647166 RepID=UPI0026E36F38|nr:MULTISPECIES: hypothetical protein [unclassified Marinovum]MDO6731423.1 hypothetical protein [Marinovum sp. 2_MG-2023]MDO6780678.1 hypothetical protein [Marinovum sp. 1_MG-2023]
MFALLKPISKHVGAVLQRSTGATPCATSAKSTARTSGSARSGLGSSSGFGQKKTGAAAPDAQRTLAVSPDLLAQLGRPLQTQSAERDICQSLFNRGRNLARQEDWAGLANLIAANDRARATTPSGAPISEILAVGARSDLSRALLSVSEAGALSPNHPMLAGLEALDHSLGEHRDTATCAALLALAHMDAGWAWYKQGWQRGRPEQHVAAFQQSFSRAAQNLAPFSPAMEDSPFLASARCGLLAGIADADRRVSKDFRALIALAPQMPGHMRAYGLHLLPRWFGSYAKLEVEARQIAAQTQPKWGAGGYSWVYMDALLQDPATFAFLDIDFFLEGLTDIHQATGCQHMTNLLAAYLSHMLLQSGTAGPDSSQRRALTRHRDQLIRDEMTETHSWVWSILDTGYGTPGADHLTQTTADAGLGQAWAAISTALSRDLRRLHSGAQPAQ